MQAERLEQHLEQVSALRQRLFELDQQIESGSYSVETLVEFSDVYRDYLQIRTTDGVAHRPNLLQRLIRRKQ